MYSSSIIVSAWLLSAAAAAAVLASQHTLQPTPSCPLVDDVFGSTGLLSNVCPAVGRGRGKGREEANETATLAQDNKPVAQDGPLAQGEARAQDEPPAQDEPSAKHAASLAKDPWIKAPICHTIPNNNHPAPAPEYCTYTHATFAHNLGISIITTPSTFLKLAALPIFHQQQQQQQRSGPQDPSPPPPPPPPPPYKPTPIPAKGIGLVTTTTLAPAERYLTRTPAIMLDDTAFTALGRARLTALLAQAVGALPGRHRGAYLNLTTGSGEEDVDVDVEDGEGEDIGERAYAIFMRNNFRTEVGGVEVFHSAFTTVSRLNHACRPNSDYFFDDATLSHNVFAAEKIPSGEELTVTYLDPIQTHQDRQHDLLRSWGFQCTCALCTHPSPASDTRITQIRAIWADLDDYTPANTAATPQKAEELVRLYREEGLVTRMVEAYYRAAVEWNGVGDAARARAAAESAVAAGAVMEAGIRPFMGSMRELARAPEGHWTWRFRVRERE